MKFFHDSRLLGPAIIATGKDSLEVAKKLAAKFPKSRIFGTTKAMELVFKSYRQIIFIGALSIAARKAAPLLKSKHLDPAIVVVDIKEQFAISYLGGHLGGGNILCHKVATKLEATPVITTASDSKGLLTPDLLASMFNLFPESTGKKKQSKIFLHINKRIVEGEKICWEIDSPYKEEIIKNLEAKNFQNPSWIDLSQLFNHEKRQSPEIIISHRKTLNSNYALALRPRSIIAGIGCRKGTSVEDILKALEETFHKANISILSLRAIASVKQKRSEPGLIQASNLLNLPGYFFEPGELSKWLNENNDLEKESKFVKNTIGVGKVCEPAAKKAAVNQKILLKKTVSSSRKVTIALARATWPWWALDPEENQL